jgi:thioredoxin-like negative regulator of GroEL
LQREYAVKARLQLARFFAGNRQPDEAQRILETLLADAELDKLYRALTLVQMISLLDQNQRKQEAAEYRNALIQLYQDLARRFPDKRALFEQIAPRSEVERLQAN